MPNKIRILRKKDRLTLKQRARVATLRKEGFKPTKVYRRGRRLSVRDPIVDSVRVARVPKNLNRVKKYPHAYDTSFQRKHILKKSSKKVKGMRKVKKNSDFFKQLFNP